MSNDDLTENAPQPHVPLISSYCFNILDLVKHELDRLNHIDEADLPQQSIQQRKILNEIGIDERLQYGDVAFGVLENGYFLHAISSAAHTKDYNREAGAFHARKHLDAAVWEMSAFAVKDEAAERLMSEDSADENQVRYRHPMADTWQQSRPRAIVTQGMGNERNSPFVFLLNVGHVLGWIYGVENINEHYKDVIMAFGVLPNDFIVIGKHQAYSHDSYDFTAGLMDAYSDLERECLKYRLFVSKKAQHEINSLHDLAELVELSELEELSENAYIDIPDSWESSTATPEAIDKALDQFEDVPIQRTDK